MGKFCQECGETMRNPEHGICWNCYNKTTQQKKESPLDVKPYGKKETKKGKKDKGGLDFTDPLTIGAIAFFVGLVIGIML